MPDYWTRSDSFGSIPPGETGLLSVNSHGDSVGWTIPSGGKMTGLYRQAGGSLTLVDQPDWYLSYLTDVNAAGVAIGNVSVQHGATSTEHVFIYRNGTTQVLDQLEATPAGINDEGTIALTPHGSVQPVLRTSDGALHTLSTGESFVAWATDIANGGWVGGAAFSPAAEQFTAARWTPDGVLELLETPSGYGYSTVMRINADGDAAGFASNENTVVPVRWHGPHATILESGYAGKALGINSQGAVVGLIQANDGNVHAAVWAGDAVEYVDDYTQTTYDTEHLLYDINDSGLIVGNRLDQSAGVVYQPHNGVYAHMSAPKVNFDKRAAVALPLLRTRLVAALATGASIARIDLGTNLLARQIVVPLP